jgi:clan AA aspartic protease (TIGR02281 family)
MSQNICVEYRLFIRLALALFLIAAFHREASADTVYLKNGGVLEGFIAREDESSVVLDLGFGTVSFRRDYVDSIYRSTEEESVKIRDKWQERQRIMDQKWEEAKARQKERYEEDTRQIQLQQEGSHVVVEALLNKKVRAQLFLDTGASFILLTRKVGKNLGVNFDDTKDLIEMRLADGRKIKAKYVVLETVSVQGKQAESIDAAVLLADPQDPSLKDGLLGMSFLKHFNFGIDHKNRKLILQKTQ